MPFTVELRDWSPNAVAELDALATRYGGHLEGFGPEVTMRAPTRNAAETIFHVLEADPRVNSERAAAEHPQLTAEHGAERVAARRNDRIAQLQAKVAEQAARIAELEARG
jgi:hypothetical protein